MQGVLNNLHETIDLIDDSETIIIYGCSIESGMFTVEQLKYRKNLLFCDRLYEIYKEVCEIPVISPQELLDNYRNNKILLGVGEATSQVHKFLMDNNINKENITISATKDIQSQYFDDIIKFDDNEIFVDAGGFDGNTSVLFAKHCPNYKKIYIWEPDETNLSLIRDNNNLKQLENIDVIPLGTWDKKETLCFDAERFAGCKITDTGETKINCDSLDNVLGDEPVTFIKMDIEGAELNALKGAKNIITKYKPKLAISLYHKPEDIVEIPLYIKSIVPEYKLYIRHYSTTYSETVLYAVL